MCQNCFYIAVVNTVCHFFLVEQCGEEPMETQPVSVMTTVDGQF